MPEKTKVRRTVTLDPEVDKYLVQKAAEETLKTKGENDMNVSKLINETFRQKMEKDPARK